MAVYFGGSRKLQIPSNQVGQVVLATLQSGEKIQVGCCLGADQAVISSAIGAGGLSFLVVFAIFNEQGQGACSQSASYAVQMAHERGASVHFLAGGPLNVPLNARLIRRSARAFQGCSAAIFFEPGPGSLAVASLAAHKMPVYAFAQSIPAQIPNQAGQWAPSHYQGFPCFIWQAAQLTLI